MRPSEEPFIEFEELQFQQVDLQSRAAVPWVVFRGEPQPEDVKQGSIGNCWLMCAMSVLSAQPQHIRKLFVTQEYSPPGAYQVRLCRAGEWHTITVDDILPVNQFKVLTYTKPRRRSLWGPLIEKAAAKVCCGFALSYFRTSVSCSLCARAPQSPPHALLNPTHKNNIITAALSTALSTAAPWIV
jgi:calpain-15